MCCSPSIPSALPLLFSRPAAAASGSQLTARGLVARLPRRHGPWVSRNTCDGFLEEIPKISAESCAACRPNGAFALRSLNRITIYYSLPHSAPLFRLPRLELDMAEATPTMVFVYGTLKRGFPNHPLLAASASPFAGAASTTAPASLVIGPYSVPFLFPAPSPSSGRVVSGELYAASPSALSELDALEGTHIGVYERRRISVVVDGSAEAVEVEAYFAHPSYAEALWRRCGGEAAEIGEYTMDHAARYVPPSGRSPAASGLIDAIHSFLVTDN